MRNKLFSLALSVTALAFIVIVVGKYVIVAQTPITGEWTAETRQDKHESADSDAKQLGPRIQLNFSRSTPHGHSSNGSSYNFGDLQGLRPEQATNGTVRFSLV